MSPDQLIHLGIKDLMDAMAKYYSQPSLLVCLAHVHNAQARLEQAVHDIEEQL